MTTKAPPPVAALGRSWPGTGAAPRWLHPGAWWLWAFGLAAAASRTNQPVLLLGLLAAAAAVVAARRPAAPWARSFRVFLVLGAFVIAIRVAMQLVFGADTGGTLLFTLPQVPLPAFLAGVALGGPVTLEGLLAAFLDGLRLAVLLACLGAATSLASPSRLLKAVPAALYEVGVAVVVTLTLAPQMVADLARVRQAQRLRGRPATGARGWWSAAVPVVHGSLERSVALAAAMDSRGYGRRAQVPRRARMTTSALLLVGIFGLLVGVYGVLSDGALSPAAPGLVLGGAGLAVLGLALAGQRQVRTRYRPDPWVAPEWSVAAAGLAVLVLLVLAGPAALTVGTAPLAWPPTPGWLVLAPIVAALPALLAPPLPLAVRR
jgi:energy-coupling factor transport system permease protein